MIITNFKLKPEEKIEFDEFGVKFNVENKSKKEKTIKVEII